MDSYRSFGNGAKDNDVPARIIQVYTGQYEAGVQRTFQKPKMIVEQQTVLFLGRS